jgi:TusA-related sulfurtransferase
MRRMSKTVDARGLACPQPVILTRRAMAEAGEVVSKVDSKISRDDVRRMAEKAGRQVTVDEKGAEFHLHIVGSGAQPDATRAPAGRRSGWCSSNSTFFPT